MRKIWSELAKKCEAKGIEYSQNDDANVLEKKLKAKPKPTK